MHSAPIQERSAPKYPIRGDNNISMLRNSSVQYPGKHQMDPLNMLMVRNVGSFSVGRSLQVAQAHLIRLHTQTLKLVRVSLTNVVH